MIDWQKCGARSAEKNLMIKVPGTHKGGVQVGFLASALVQCVMQGEALWLNGIECV